jgi:hypothetical protein
MLETSGLMIAALDINAEAIIGRIRARIIMLDIFRLLSIRDQIFYSRS